MNIYIHVEISTRELDSKLLLATLAAGKGHEVIISSSVEIISALSKKILKPGLFHTKSLTPSKTKITRHQKIIENKSVVSSIDEEGAINDYGYEQFAKDRYSEVSISQSAVVLGWGDEDTETLKKRYNKYSGKIHKTGSPRIDLWRPFFSSYWTTPKEIPNKPFLLISSNLFSTSYKPFFESIKHTSDAGYFKRDPKLFKKSFYTMGDDFKKLYEFIIAIKFLAENNNGYDIVLRPHPVENIKAWEVFLENIPNVHIIRKDSITTWVKNAFAVMHSSCTTGIEATISGKPLLTYSPPALDYDANILSNKLGYVVKSKEELLKKTNEIFEAEASKNLKNEEVKIPDIISKKVFIDNKEFAAEKILKIWENFNDKNLSQSNNWLNFYCFLKIINFKTVIKKLASRLFPKVIKSVEENHKFPPLDQKDIQERVYRLQNILGIEKKLKCRIISERTILIKN